MKKKNGFTLIELLAVIIILGILMIIAIPSVTSYINNSRKSAYVDSAKEIIAGARNLVNEGKLEMFDTNVIYYIPAKYINTENGLKSPYGDFTEAYVGVTYDGKGYNYYWVSNDTSGQGVVEITLIGDLDEDLIESDINDLDIIESIMTTEIEGKTIVKVFEPDTSQWRNVTNNQIDVPIIINPGAISDIIIGQQLIINDANGKTWREYANSDNTEKQVRIHPDLNFAYSSSNGYSCSASTSIDNYLVIYDASNVVDVDNTIINGHSYSLKWQYCLKKNGTFESCNAGERVC